MPGNRHPHKYEELFPEEFWEEFERTPIAYFTCSPLEWHGPHNALGCDPLKGYHVCLRAAEISGGIVLPPMFVGPAGLPSLSRAG
ncbi:MAG: creatininase family protein, partial [Armatimonadetes bacterium]|nr:creatininase family protein [Armatimonadota bacterium]